MILNLKHLFSVYYLGSVLFLLGTECLSSDEQNAPSTRHFRESIVSVMLQLRDSLNIVSQRMEIMQLNIKNIDLKIRSLETNMDIMEIEMESTNSNIVALNQKIGNLNVCNGKCGCTDRINEMPSDTKTESAITCEGRKMIIRCTEQGKTINIINANYGRTESGDKVCPHPKIITTNCVSVQSKSKVVSKCQGKSNCDIEATNSIFGDPCIHTYKYLKVEYSCV